MNSIFKRNLGTVRFNPDTENEISATIPDDESALLFACNTVADGEVFDKDGWVYLNGQKQRKWFSNCEGWNHFWKPILNDVKHLEEVYQKVKLRHQKRLDRLWDHVKLVAQTVTGEDKPGDRRVFQVPASVSPSSFRHEYYIYDVIETDGKLSLSMHWSDSLINEDYVDLGRQLAYLESVVMKSSIKRGMEYVLDMAIINKIEDNPSFLEGMIEMQINDRRYVYRRDQYQLIRHCWPEDNYHIISL